MSRAKGQHSFDRRRAPYGRTRNGLLAHNQAKGLNSNKGTKSDIEIAPAKRFEAVVQIGSGGVVVTGDKLLAGAISQQALDLRTMEAAPASGSPTAR